MLEKRNMYHLLNIHWKMCAKTMLTFTPYRIIVRPSRSHRHQHCSLDSVPLQLNGSNNWVIFCLSYDVIVNLYKTLSVWTQFLHTWCWHLSISSHRMPGSFCCMVGCSTNSAKFCVSFHGFPKKGTTVFSFFYFIFCKWMNKINREYFVITGCRTSTKMCFPFCFLTGKSQESDEWRRLLVAVINRCDKSFNPNTAKICSRHFEEDCFLIRKYWSKRSYYKTDVVSRNFLCYGKRDDK